MCGIGETGQKGDNHLIGVKPGGIVRFIRQTGRMSVHRFKSEPTVRQADDERNGDPNVRYGKCGQPHSPLRHHVGHEGAAAAREER